MEKHLSSLEAHKSASMSSNYKNPINLNLVDPKWETLDPTPDIHSLLATFNDKFFQGLLNCVELEWSTKMYSCAGICYWSHNNLGAACVIRLSEPLLKLRPRKDLVETLLHEMIHAWNFIRGISEENGGHGQYFLSKMHEINQQAGTSISVYHNFHDEVDFFKIHCWRCNGRCQKRSPYYGFVKKAENIAPGPYEKWWTRHAESCEGQFIKVQGLKINNNSSTVISVLPTPRPATPSEIPTFDLTGFENDGRVNGKKWGTKKKSFNPDDSIIVIDDSFTEIPPPARKSLHATVMWELDDDGIIFIDDEFDDNISQRPKATPKIAARKSHCPVCNVELDGQKINEHLDRCLS